MRILQYLRVNTVLSECAYVNQVPDKAKGQEIWELGQFLYCPIVRSGIKCKGNPGNFQSIRKNFCRIDYF